ncbi:GDYXXLXY domain-containing protein [Maricaulis salignorans]|uniref:Uncharacterized membrane-anchored protein n=1 Tax=Maricaulis salignorans TaxID=144026 RepID=A0A1G9TTB1_9PROT|nr:GDYXXLXY domain-containing protein [Maricaulis salignorans]SDM50983.1 Uncharacterized membrane-anchored protein [Maricaulis salignorans]
MSHLVRLGIVAAAMTAFLGYLVINHANARANGTEVVLDVRGYDPRDIFLGHYSLIATELQRLDAAALAGEDEFDRGDSIYVVLAPGDDGDWRPVSLHSQRPDAGIFIHGFVRSSYRTESGPTDPLSDEASADAAAAPEIWIHSAFNIERYYASRDMAQQFETRLRQLDPDGGNGVRLILSLPPNGDAIIKGFEIDGVRRIDRLW